MKSINNCYIRSERAFQLLPQRGRCSSSRSFRRKFGFLGLFFTSNNDFNLQKFLLQLLQYLILLNESKDSKGFNGVTSCNKNSKSVTICYKSVTICYKVCYRVCYNLQLSTVKGFT